MVVLRAGGRVADGVVEVARPATQAALDFATRLGFEAIEAHEQGLLRPEDAEALLASYGAKYAMTVQIGGVAFSWAQRVLTARGRMRIAILDRRGSEVFDRWLRTDTVVGSRGDGHAALVYFVAEQAGYIAQPLVEKKLR